jgi:hypothetical protein
MPRALLRRAVFYYTSKHSNWLNMAEIEIGALDRQCLNRRLPDRTTLTTGVDAWQRRRNAEHLLHRVVVYAAGCG